MKKNVFTVVGTTYLPDGRKLYDDEITVSVNENMSEIETMRYAALRYAIREICPAWTSHIKISFVPAYTIYQYSV